MRVALAVKAIFSILIGCIRWRKYERLICISAGIVGEAKPFPKGTPNIILP
jgi:hypothetical protein